MKTTNRRLIMLWEQHRAQALPCPESSEALGGVDYVDLVELDTYIAGYVSRVVDGEVLQGEDLRRFAALDQSLCEKLDLLNGEIRYYFNRLATMGRAAMGVCYRPH